MQSDILVVTQGSWAVKLQNRIPNYVHSGVVYCGLSVISVHIPPYYIARAKQIVYFWRLCKIPRRNL